MANLTTVPDAAQIQLNFSIGGNQASSWQHKYVPKNIDGTIFNCTAAATATIYVNTPTYINPSNNANFPCTIGTADATGVVLSMTEAQVINLLSAMTSGTTKYTIAINNGVDNFLTGIGNVIVAVQP